MSDLVDFSTIKRLPSLDYQKVITREHIDMNIYNKKFEAAQNIIDYNLLTDPYAVELLDDPTIYAYIFIRLNGERVKLFPYQDVIANDNHRFIYFCAANQIGKSMCLDVLAIFHLLRKSSVNIAIVSKSLDQSKFQMSRIRQLLNESRILWKEETGDTESIRLISMNVNDSTNRLICAPCTEGLLGYDLHYLFLDELEFWTEDIKYFYEQIAQPRTYSTKGQIVVFTNPNGQGYGMELENQKLLNRQYKWHRYNFNFLDKPGNTQQEYDQLQFELPRAQFESTVAAIRTMSDRCFFTPQEIEGSYDAQLDNMKNHIVDKYTFWALDVGSKHDQSCLVGGYIEPDESNEKFNHLYIFCIHLYPVGYPISRVAGVDIEEGDGWHWEKSVKEYLEEYTFSGVRPEFGFDVTGNAGMKALFDKMGIEAQEILFSGPQKSGYYQKFKMYMEKGLLHRIRHKEFEKQCSELIVSKSQRGYLLINAASHTKVGGKSEDAKLKGIPDDVCDGVAGLIALADPSSTEVSVMRF